MCQTFTFHHVCGHVYHKTIIQCPDSIDQVMACNDPKPIARSQGSIQTLCTDANNDIEVVPTICETCTQIGVISEWLNQTPEARFDVVRSWTNELRERKNEARGRAAERRKKRNRDQKASTDEYVQRAKQQPVDDTNSDTATASDEIISASDLMSEASSKTSMSIYPTPPEAYEEAVPVPQSPTQLRRRIDQLKDKILRSLGHRSRTLGLGSRG